MAVVPFPHPPPPAVSPTARGVTVVATSSPSPRGPARQSNQLLTASTPGARPEREWTEQKRLATVAAGALFLGTPRQGGADGALPAAVGSNARSPCPTFPPSPPRLVGARARGCWTRGPARPAAARGESRRHGPQCAPFSPQPSSSPASRRRRRLSPPQKSSNQTVLCVADSFGESHSQQTA